MNNKSAPIPEGTRPEIERFLQRLGYRLVLRRLEHPASVKPGRELSLKLEWENAGSAPPYRDYRLALRLLPLDQAVSSLAVIPTEESIRGWLPGPRKSELNVSLPANLQPGAYELALGLVAPGGQAPEVKLAIEGRTSAGWYPLTRLEVAN